MLHTLLGVLLTTIAFGGYVDDTVYMVQRHRPQHTKDTHTMFFVSSQPTRLRNEYNGHVGFSFVPITNSVITSLGRQLYQGILRQDVEVDLWDDQTKLALATVTVGPNSSITGQWAWESLATPQQVIAGRQYVLSQRCFGGMNDLWAHTASNIITAPEFTFRTARWGANYRYPQDGYGTYFSGVVNFMFASTLTTTTTAAAGATGDPHCTNVRGERFDVFATGHLTMVQVPRHGDSSGEALLVKALVVPINTNPCAPTVITRVDIQGTWLDGMPPLNIKPGRRDVPELPEIWQNYRHGGVETRELHRRNVVEIVMLKHDLHVVVRQHTGPRTGMMYLDLMVRNLAKIGEESGGLLGLDSHAAEAQQVPGCDPHVPVSLYRDAGTTDDEEPTPARGRLLSELSNSEFADEV